jgi:hypothetical protein
VGLSTEADGGPHRVEEVGQHDREYREHGRDHTHLREEPEGEVADQREAVGAGEIDDAAEVGPAPPEPLTVEQRFVHDDRNYGGHQDADKQRASNAPYVEEADDQKADDEDADRPPLEFAAGAQLQGRSRDRRRGHEAGVDEANDRDEETDADADGVLQGKRHCLHDGDSELGEDENEDDQPLEHDHPHGLGPGQLVASDELERNDCVETEAGGNRERVVGVRAHSNRGDACSQCRDRKDRRCREGVAVSVRDRQDRWVEKKDVPHRHEGRQAGDDLGPNAGASLRDLEVAVPPIPARRNSLGHSLASRFPRALPVERV